MSEIHEHKSNPENKELITDFDLKKYFDSLYEDMLNGKKTFDEAEDELSTVLQRLTGNSEIRVEISSDDEQELADMDWTSAPFLNIYNGPKNEVRETRRVTGRSGAEYDQIHIKVTN